MPKRLRNQLKEMQAVEHVDFLLSKVEDDRLLWSDRIAAVVDRGDLPFCGAHGLSLLLYLWDRRAKTVPMERLQWHLERTFDIEYMDPHNVRGHIKRLRKSLGIAGWPIIFETIYGVGYRLMVSDPDFNIERTDP